MANYVVTSKQMLATTVSIAALQAAFVFATISFYEWQQLPEVAMDGDKCVKVINYRNGDAYQCQDKDIVLRNYRIAKE